MNEYSILLHLLTRKRGEHGEKIGSTTEEIVKALDLEEKNYLFQYNRILKDFCQYIRPLGLSLQFNPMNAHWYLIQDKDTVEHFKENPLFSTPRLAATLLVILLLSVLKKQTTIAKVAEYRNVKNVKQDLKELKDMGYIDYDDTYVQLTEKLVYNVDIQRLIEKIEYEQMVQSYIDRLEAKNKQKEQEEETQQKELEAETQQKEQEEETQQKEQEEETQQKERKSRTKQKQEGKTRTKQIKKSNTEPEKNIKESETLLDLEEER